LTKYPYLLVSDFDGTITENDFYQLALERVDRNGMPDYWSLYASGRITHFEAMRGIFSHIRCDEATIRSVVKSLRPDSRLKDAVARLRRSGWDVMIVSAGSSWYIAQVLEAAGVSVPVHASPGHFSPSAGLHIELPFDSPFCSPELGIDKKAAVLAGQSTYERVAFAGNGPPDLEAVLSVPPELRFARDWLADELSRRKETFCRFSRWSEIADRLTAI
jgi:Haloacid Dehalogenase superfamily, subfamily IB, phosphoserine phosphatase-like/2,3-diketo-5-methylthio-1-phosphopentane phosphatase